jgi:hypothetical protein
VHLRVDGFQTCEQYKWSLVRFKINIDLKRWQRETKSFPSPPMISQIGGIAHLRIGLELRYKMF